MTNKLYDLTKLIRLMALDVSKSKAYWKKESVSSALGLFENDLFFDEISVTDDSGYRCIIIGDTRGNTSRVNGRRILEKEHKGYMCLYSENSPFHYRCFPSIKEIYSKLIAIRDKQILLDEFSWYEREDPKALDYYAEVVMEHVKILERMGKRPREIFKRYIDTM